MAEFTNAQKLAAVVSKWARPAISQIASSKLMQLPFMKGLQATVASSGLVRQDYDLSVDVQPLVMPVVDALVTPMVERAIANVPDDAVPQMAHSMVQHMKSQGSFSILDGIVTFDASDFEELEQLLNRNLPVEEHDKYQVI